MYQKLKIREIQNLNRGIAWGYGKHFTNFVFKLSDV